MLKAVGLVEIGQHYRRLVSRLMGDARHAKLFFIIPINK